jgi:hypothetical protein
VICLLAAVGTMTATLVGLYFALCIDKTRK